IITGNDEAALVRLWQEKRGEVEPEDLSGNLVVQLGLATEDLNRRWYQHSTGQVLTDIQRRIRHPALRWMAATLDGRVEATGAEFATIFTRTQPAHLEHEQAKAELKSLMPEDAKEAIGHGIRRAAPSSLCAMSGAHRRIARQRRQTPHGQCRCLRLRR